MRDTERKARPGASMTRVWVGIVIVAAAGTALLAVLAPEPMWDERVHQEQVVWLTEGFFARQPWLPMLPIYHGLVAAPASLLGIDSLAGLRAISALIGLSSVGVFFLLARQRSERPQERTLQYLFLLLLFPYFFLVYTDASSLLFVLLTALLLARDRFLGAGLTGLVSVLVRQTNIVWLGFLFLWDTLRRREPGESVWTTLKSGMVRNPIMVATAPAFLVAVAINGGVALDDQAFHPLGIYGGNVWFFFVAAFVAFAPLHLGNARRVLELARRPWVAVGLVVALPIYWFTFDAPHIFNVSEWFLRNRLLNAVEGSDIVKIGIFVLIAYTALSLSKIDFRERVDYLVYPFTLLALLPTLLVEVRYMLFPLVWVGLARQRSTDRRERVLLAYEVVVSLVALWLFSTELFY